MSIRTSSIADLPSALGDGVARRIDDLRPAVFLDYDGTLTPIVDRPEDALISASMREVVSRLAERCPIWSPQTGTIPHQAATRFEELLATVTAELREALGPIEGAAVEPKRASVAAHYRLVAEPRRAEVEQVVDGLLAEHADELKVTPGKMVFVIQPKLDWDKGRAVLHLLTALELDGDGVVPIYVGDDITDEHAFEAIEEVERFLDSLAR